MEHFFPAIFKQTASNCLVSHASFLTVVHVQYRTQIIIIIIIIIIIVIIIIIIIIVILHTITWIRTLLSFEILRSVHTCVRGSRSPFHKIPQGDFIDDCRLNASQACSVR